MAINRKYENYIVLAMLIIYMIFIRLYVQFNPDSFRSIQQMQALDWPFIGIWAALGIVGLFFYQKSGFPGVFDPTISSKRHWLIPIATGLALGSLSILNDQVTHWTDYVETKMNIPSVHISFPQSILIYPAGAMVHEIFNRIFLLSLLLWLLQKISNGKIRNFKLFVVAAALTSLIEPYGDVGLWEFSAVAMVSSFLLDYLINLSQAHFMYTAGFLASVISRISLYMVWHVAYGFYGGY